MLYQKQVQLRGHLWYNPLRGDTMKRRAKLVLQLLSWILILCLIIWIPETSFIVLIVMVTTAIYKRIRDKPILTFKIKKK